MGPPARPCFNPPISPDCLAERIGRHESVGLLPASGAGCKRDRQKRSHAKAGTCSGGSFLGPPYSIESVVPLAGPARTVIPIGDSGGLGPITRVAVSFANRVDDRLSGIDAGGRNRLSKSIEGVMVRRRSA
jgi:hypothetical protein